MPAPKLKPSPPTVVCRNNRSVVELRVHEGLQKRRGRLCRAKLPQHFVWLKSEPDDDDVVVGDEPVKFERVGLVSDQPGCRFCAHVPLVEFSKDELELINEAIKELHGGIAPPPPSGIAKHEEEIDPDELDETDFSV